MSEITSLLDKYKNENQYELVNFCDLNFINESKKGLTWVDDFVLEMKKQNSDFFFNIMTRVDSIVNQKKRVTNLRDVGLAQIEMGLEAGTDDGLNVYNKKINPNQSIEAAEFLREQRIDFGVSGFIMYHPYITIDELRRNAKFLKEINYWKINFLVTKMALYPGSAITDKIKREGMINDTYCHYGVFDYKFLDNKVEFVYNKIKSKLTNPILNEISNAINYIELQFILFYRKIENLNIYPKAELEHIIEIIEKPVKTEIYKSKLMINDFFCEILDLAEGESDDKFFDYIINKFNRKYVSQKEKILTEYETYSTKIINIV